MTKLTQITLASLLSTILAAPALSAADWPQWLGPARNGASPEKVAPWKGDLKVLWRQAVGVGHSSPVVVHGVVYLHYKLDGQTGEALHAFEAATGNPLWQSSYPTIAYKGLFGNGPRATPAIADGRVFTHGITGLVTCFDAASGKQVWQVDTQKDLKAPKLFFGAASSPLVVGKRVVVMVGAKGACLVAFDCKDGAIKWKALDEGASYSSPALLDAAKQPQLVALTKKRLLGLNPDDGSLYWEHPLVDSLAESSVTPALVGDRMLIGSSITYGSVGLKLETNEKKPSVTKRWHEEKLNSYFTTPIGIGTDQAYFVTSTRPPADPPATAMLFNVDPATGKAYWSRPNIGKYHASLLRTGDDKLLMLEEDGSLVLIEPNVKEYRELARSKICGNTWSHPALVDGYLYIRDGKELICVQVGPGR